MRLWKLRASEEAFSGFSPQRISLYLGLTSICALDETNRHSEGERTPQVLHRHRAFCNHYHTACPLVFLPSLFETGVAGGKWRQPTTMLLSVLIILQRL